MLENSGNGFTGQLAFTDPSGQPSLISPDSSEWLSGTDPSLFTLSDEFLTAESVPLNTFNLASVSSDPLDLSLQAPNLFLQAANPSLQVPDTSIQAADPFVETPNLFLKARRDDNVATDPDTLAFLDGSDTEDLQASLFAGNPVVV